MASHVDFIIAAKEKLERNAKPPTNYVSGEIFYLLGEKLTLTLHGDKVFGSAVRGEALYVYVKSPEDFECRKRAVQRFFDGQCSVLEDIVQRIYPLFEPYRKKFPELSLRTMKSRWGSCLPAKNKITLNKKLVHLPIPCIEYVVAHEFCHFIHPNHSRDFYAFMAEFMPDWKERRALLKRLGSQS